MKKLFAKFFGKEKPKKLRNKAALKQGGYAIAITAVVVAVVPATATLAVVPVPATVIPVRTLADAPEPTNVFDTASDIPRSAQRTTPMGAML